MYTRIDFVDQQYSLVTDQPDSNHKQRHAKNKNLGNEQIGTWELVRIVRSSATKYHGVPIPLSLSLLLLYLFTAESSLTFGSSFFILFASLLFFSPIKFSFSPSKLNYVAWIFRILGPTIIKCLGLVNIQKAFHFSPPHPAYHRRCNSYKKNAVHNLLISFSIFIVEKIISRQ